MSPSATSTHGFKSLRVWGHPFWGRTGAWSNLIQRKVPLSVAGGGTGWVSPKRHDSMMRAPPRAARTTFPSVPRGARGRTSSRPANQQPPGVAGGAGAEAARRWRPRAAGTGSWTRYRERGSRAPRASPAPAVPHGQRPASPAHSPAAPGPPPFTPGHPSFTPEHLPASPGHHQP